MPKELSRRAFLATAIAGYGSQFGDSRRIRDGVSAYSFEMPDVQLSDEEKIALNHIYDHLGYEGVKLLTLNPRFINQEPELLGFERIGYNSKAFGKFIKTILPNGMLFGNVSKISLVLGVDRKSKGGFYGSTYLNQGSAEIKIRLSPDVESKEGLDDYFMVADNNPNSFIRVLMHEIAHANDPQFNRNLSPQERILFLNELITFFNKYSKDSEFINSLPTNNRVTILEKKPLKDKILEFWAIIFSKAQVGDFENNFIDLHNFCYKWMTLKDPGYKSRMDSYTDEQINSMQKEMILDKKDKRIVVQPDTW